MNKFNKIYNKIIFETSNDEFKCAKTFIKKSFKKHAIKVNQDGYVMTREGKAHYKAGDFLAWDKQGGQYPIPANEFEKLYEPTDDKEYWMSKPVEVKMFKTDKEMYVETEWGTYKADAGDWIEIKKDGTYGPPRKPDVIITDYNEKE